MFTNFTTKNVYTPMRNCEIKFVNKEITPFGGLSLSLKECQLRPIYIDSFLSLVDEISGRVENNAFP